MSNRTNKKTVHAQLKNGFYSMIAKEETLFTTTCLSGFITARAQNDIFDYEDISEDYIVLKELASEDFFYITTQEVFSYMEQNSFIEEGHDLDDYLQNDYLTSELFEVAEEYLIEKISAYLFRREHFSNVIASRSVKYITINLVLTDRQNKQNIEAYIAPTEDLYLLIDYSSESYEEKLEESSAVPAIQ